MNAAEALYKHRHDATTRESHFADCSRTILSDDTRSPTLCDCSHYLIRSVVCLACAGPRGESSEALSYFAGSSETVVGPRCISWRIVTTTDHAF